MLGLFIVVTKVKRLLANTAGKKELYGCNTYFNQFLDPVSSDFFV